MSITFTSHFTQHIYFSFHPIVFPFAFGNTDDYRDKAPAKASVYSGSVYQGWSLIPPEVLLLCHNQVSILWMTASSWPSACHEPSQWLHAENDEKRHGLWAVFPENVCRCRQGHPIWMLARKRNSFTPEICVFPDSYIDDLTPQVQNITILGHGVFKNIKFM